MSSFHDPRNESRKTVSFDEDNNLLRFLSVLVAIGLVMGLVGLVGGFVFMVLFAS